MDKNDQSQWFDKLQDMNHQTPYMVTDLSKVRNNVLALIELMPDVEIFYAVKSNNDPAIINIIDDLVAGYDIASIGEQRLLASLGIKSERILYSNPVKIPWHIKEAYKQNVRYFALDSLTEISKLAQYAPGSIVYTRLKVSDVGSSFPLSSKFGSTAQKAVEYALLAADAGLKPEGIAFHVGSQSLNPGSWTEAIITCGQIITTLQKKGISTSFINLGGGIPAPYVDTTVPIQLIAQAINVAVKKYLPEGIRIIAEPGRSVSASSSVIVTSVIGRETRGSSEEWLFLDMGVFQGLMEPLEMPSWRYPIFSKNAQQNDPDNTSYVLTGPTCDACDTIGDNYSLPSGLGVDDQLCIGSTGAYTTAYKSNFNGFDPPEMYYVNG